MPTSSWACPGSGEHAHEDVTRRHVTPPDATSCYPSGSDRKLYPRVQGMDKIFGCFPSTSPGRLSMPRRYQACGRSTLGHHRGVLRRACQLKRQHPTWGAGRIRVELLGLLDAALVPSPRTLQRAFQREGSTALGEPSGRGRREPGPRCPTTSGRWTPWRRRGCGAAKRSAGWPRSTPTPGRSWRASFPPQAQWQTIPPKSARGLFRRVFARWGLPRAVRVDNGHPWGLNRGLPPALALWLIGLGVAVEWIDPGQPRQNPKVERGNGVTQPWAEPASCSTRA
jgi:hypothetical protein